MCAARCQNLQIDVGTDARTGMRIDTCTCSVGCKSAGASVHRRRCTLWAAFLTYRMALYSYGHRPRRPPLRAARCHRTFHRMLHRTLHRMLHRMFHGVLHRTFHRMFYLQSRRAASSARCSVRGTTPTRCTRRSAMRSTRSPPTSPYFFFRDALRPSPTACPSRGYWRAGTQNDRLGESLPTVRGAFL